MSGGGAGGAGGGTQPPRIALVTDRWDDAGSEASLVAHRLGGALALLGPVEVVAVGAQAPPGGCEGPHREGPFSVHRVPARPPDPVAEDLFTAALAHGGGVAGAPPEVAARLHSLMEGEASAVGRLLADLTPDLVVVVGWHWPAAARVLAGPAGRQLVVAPALGDGDGTAAEEALAPLLGAAGALVASSDHEAARLEGLLGRGEAATGDGADALRRPRVATIGPPLPVSELARSTQLPGLGEGPYALVLEEGPVAGPRHPQAGLAAQLGAMEPDVRLVRVSSGLEIQHRGHSRRLPYRLARVDLWRLVAHAACVVDAGPPGLLGRESIESLALGTPVLVPAAGVRRHHGESSGGGLWWRDLGELRASLRALWEDPALASRLGECGARYASARYGAGRRFTDAVAELVSSVCPGEGLGTMGRPPTL